MMSRWMSILSGRRRHPHFRNTLEGGRTDAKERHGKRACHPQDPITSGRKDASRGAVRPHVPPITRNIQSKIRQWQLQNSDPPRPPFLLRARRDRPRGRRAAKPSNELAPSHSITSSARTRTVVGTSMPSALAVLRLITRSYLVAFCTGRSAGFSPLRMRST